jgi:hypothetical protein
MQLKRKRTNHINVGPGVSGSIALHFAADSQLLVFDFIIDIQLTSQNFQPGHFRTTAHKSVRIVDRQCIDILAEDFTGAIRAFILGIVPLVTVVVGIDIGALRRVRSDCLVL